MVMVIGNSGGSVVGGWCWFCHHPWQVCRGGDGDGDVADVAVCVTTLGSYVGVVRGVGVGVVGVRRRRCSCSAAALGCCSSPFLVWEAVGGGGVGRIRRRRGKERRCEGLHRRSVAVW